jgi:hypothetical protein
MKKRLVDTQRLLIANDQSAEIAVPSGIAFDGPATLVTTQNPTVLGWRPAAVGAVGCNQGDAAPTRAGVR